MISAAIIGDPQVIEKIGLLGSFAKTELHKAVDLMALKMVARVKLKLSDDVLHVRTGRLRRSITQIVKDDAGVITATVGTNVEYARRLELGFTGTETVQAHLRTIKTAFGKAIKGGSVTFTVPTYTRKINYPAHSFLASSLAELEPDFKEAVANATRRVLAS